jgi:hypothetical protein
VQLLRLLGLFQGRIFGRLALPLDQVGVFFLALFELVHAPELDDQRRRLGAPPERHLDVGLGVALEAHQRVHGELDALWACRGQTAPAAPQHVVGVFFGSESECSEKYQYNKNEISKAISVSYRKSELVRNVNAVGTISTDVSPT